jgi:putative transposase
MIPGNTAGIMDRGFARWEFLDQMSQTKTMHLKLDRLITKNVNEVRLQIYMALIEYLILELMEVPLFYGHRLLDKFRYLQLELSRRRSIIRR